MKVFIGKNGVSGKAYNNKAKISHEVAPKDTLSKRSGGVISNKYVRTVGGNTEKQRSASNATAQKRHNGNNSARSVRTETKSNAVGIEKAVAGNPEKPHSIPNAAAQKREHYETDSPKYSKSENYSAASGEKIIVGNSEKNPLQPTAQKETRFEARTLQTSIERHGIASEMPRGIPSVEARKREYYGKEANLPNQKNSPDTSGVQKESRFETRTLQTSIEKHGIASEKPRGIPSTEARMREFYAKESPKFSNQKSSSDISAAQKESRFETRTLQTSINKPENFLDKPHDMSSTEERIREYFGKDTPKFSKQESNSVTSTAQKKSHFETRTPRTSVDKHEIVSTDGGRMLTDNYTKPYRQPIPEARKRARLAEKMLNIAPHGKYKILKNGVVGKTALTKRKTRVIGSKIAAKLHRAKLKKLTKQTVRYNREQAKLTAFAMGGAAALKKPDVSKAVGGAKKVVNLAQKPVDVLKREFYSQADKSDDNGVKAVKLGVQIKDYGVSGIKTAVRTGAKTVKNGSKIAKRVYHKIHKPTSAELRRKLQKRVNHNLVAEAKYLTKRAVKTGAKTAGKAAAKAAKTGAKATAKATAKAAQLAAKAAAATAKAVAGAVTKIAGLIAETMPWSLIIIVVIVLVVLIALMCGSLFTGAGGTVAGGGAWLVDDSRDETPVEIYEGYKEFIEQAKDVMQTQAKEALKNSVTDFCSGDTTKPRKIIQYVDKDNNVTYFPALGADSSINAMIELFGTDDYADYMSLLFVLMTREKAQADGAADTEIYDFDFKKSDFEEFMKTVNENSCRWGDTFVYKTAVETYSHTCPGEDCETEYIPGCECRYYGTDDDGNPIWDCGGHPYCPGEHTKLTVKLLTVKDYYGKEYPEIYDFTDNERTRYEASKAIIQGLLEYWEG